MAAHDRLSESKRPLLAPLTAHPEWRDLMNKDLARKVLADDVDPREAADFMLARFIRKVA